MSLKGRRISIQKKQSETEYMFFSEAGKLICDAHIKMAQIGEWKILAG